MYKSKTFNDHNVKVINNISDIDPSDCKNIKIENFYEAISNILSNSIDAFEVNDIKKPTIKLNLAESEDNISLIIEDNGGGIREDVIPNIFEPYTTTKHESQGTGLGLFLTYKIITELLNGTIDVENVTNGARFTINIPKN